MKKITLLIIYLFVLLTGTKISAQTTNLVYNGDFEIYSALPTHMTQVDLAVGWNGIDSNLNGGCGSPDYSYVGSFMYPCAISPLSGNGQMDIGINVDTNYSDGREYLSSHLYLPMATGQQYSVSFYLTNGHLTDSTYGCSTSISNNFGIHFSMSPLTQVCSEVINVNPQLEITSIINSCDNWTHYIYKYIADSSYNYITLGNFRSNVNTLYTYPPIYDNNISYFAITFFFIDKIEIYPKLKIGGDSLLCKGIPTTLNIIAGKPTVIWADSLNPTFIIATDSMITVTPLITTTYVAYNNIDTAYYTVYVNNAPQVNLGIDTILCAGQTLLLNASNTNSTYLWQDNSTDSIYNVSQQGTYWVKVTNQYNCTVYDTIIVSYHSLPLINLGNDTSLCTGHTLQLNATYPNTAYLWQDYSTDSIYNVSQSGTYWVTVTTNNICSASDTINVAFSPNPIVNLGNDTILCYGQTLTLNATNQNSTYLWQDNITDSTYNVSQQGLYWVKVTNEYNCSAYDTITVNYTAIPLINLGNDTTLCSGQTLLLKTIYPNSQYLWQDSSTDSIYNVIQTGTYWVTVTTNNICSASDTINVTYIPNPIVNFGSDTTICKGVSIILNATTPNATYLWNNGSTDAIYNVTSSGTYWVKVSINSLCSTSDTIKVNEIDVPPDFYLFSDTTLCFGTPINITIPDGTYYNVLWYDGNNTEFTHLINQEGSYYVELLNQCDTIKKDFNIKYKDCGCYIYFPNAFTPNGDGLNDYFKPVLQCELIVYELYIYNKWGELLFEAKTSDAYWDGRYKNEYVPTGVYEWLFYYKGPYTRELQSKHGSVTVIR